MPDETAARIAVLEATLRDVLERIGPQGHASWAMNTCLVSNDQVTAWWSVLGVKPEWKANG